MLSKKAQYAIRAMTFLAQEYNQGPVLVARIAATEKIPKKFLNLILLELRNHGLLESKKGKDGGYFLGKAPEQVNLATIIRIVDGPLAPVFCVSSMAYRKCDICDDETLCGIRSVMKELRDSTVQILENATLAEVVRRARELQNVKATTPSATEETDHPGLTL